jgi:TRAP-type C4-dicarboxylate transport system substrate-binding protein
VLRFGTVAPDGSPWAREVRSFGQEIESATGGQLRIKVYFNAITGDEVEMLDRLRRGQLDGAISGQMLCEGLAPSLRVSRLPGVFQGRDEAEAVLARLRPLFVKEAHQQGYTILDIVGLGPSIFLTREPVRSLTELRRVKLWRWAADEVGIAASRATGLTVQPMSLYEAAGAYDRRDIDGFLTIPSAAVAFQWSAQAHYLVDLRTDYLFGCLVVADRVLLGLPIGQQRAVRDASARLRERAGDVGRRIDEVLLGGLLEKQGVKALRVSDAFRAEYFEAARLAREKVAQSFVARDLLEQVQVMLADYRAEHDRAQR